MPINRIEGNLSALQISLSEQWNETSSLDDDRWNLVLLVFGGRGKVGFGVGIIASWKQRTTLETEGCKTDGRTDCRPDLSTLSTQTNKYCHRFLWRLYFANSTGPEFHCSEFRDNDNASLKESNSRSSTYYT